MKKLYIDGQWTDGSEIAVTRNPSNTTEVVGEYYRASALQTEDAISAAQVAAKHWSHSNIQTRADILDFIGTEILARKNELGELLAREEGKTLPEAIGEVSRAGAIFKFYAQEAIRVQGQKYQSVRSNIDIDVLREPVGVVGVIAPWNFPIAIPAWKIAPALAYGNTVVFKPADIVPGCSWALAEIISRSGLPAGVFNLTMGSGRIVGDVLTNSSRLDAMTFTGSESTGQRVLEACAKNRTKVQLEMGGKNPLVVLDDANLDQAVNVAIQGAFYSTGQRCTASSRIIVEKSMYQQFVGAMKEKMRGLKVGNALDPHIDIGPVVDQKQLDQDLFYIDMAKKEGANLVCGGERLAGSPNSYFLTPALFSDCDQSMRHVREEIFGPVASVIVANSYDDALELANDTRFGLTAGICTSSLKHATHFRKNVKAGMVMVNVPTAGVDYHVPFGGTRASSYGAREQGSSAVEFFTKLKTCYVSA